MASQGRDSVAPLWRRASAYVIDLLVIWVITFPLQRSLAIPQQKTFMEVISLFSEQTASMVMIGIVATLITVLYFALLEYYTNQTVGKIILKLYVTAKPRLAFSQALLRNLSKIDPLFVIIDTLYVLKSGSQRFLDKLAMTQVMYREEEKKEKR